MSATAFQGLFFARKRDFFFGCFFRLFLCFCAFLGVFLCFLVFFFVFRALARFFFGFFFGGGVSKTGNSRSALHAQEIAALIKRMGFLSFCATAHPKARRDGAWGLPSSFALVATFSCFWWCWAPKKREKGDFV